MKEGRWEVLIRAYEVGDARWVAVPDRAVLRREKPGWAADPLPDAEWIYQVLRTAGRDLRILG